MKTFSLLLIPVFLFSSFVSLEISSKGLSFDIYIDLGDVHGGITFTNALPFKLVSYLNPFYGDFVFIPKGFLSLDFKYLSLKIGRFDTLDDLRCEYPLFLSGKIVDPMSLDLTYEFENLTYRTKWIELYGDRGMNYKSLVWKSGGFRIGYQESTVYVDGSFNLDYFILPVPTFFAQHFLLSDVPAPRGENANSIMGGFIELHLENSRFYFQVLVDDINMNRFFYPDRFQNPDKIAWNFGMDVKTSFGTFSFGSAGATKYTFENTIPNLNYGYFYYPFYDYEGVPIPLDQNYIGYEKGENNLTFFLKYSAENFKSKVEYSLTGSQSPFNPWHELSSFPQGTHLLDDETLQKDLKLIFEHFTKFGDFQISFSSKLEWVWNVLERVQGKDGGEDILVPSERNDFEGEFVLRFEYGF